MSELVYIQKRLFSQISDDDELDCGDIHNYSDSDEPYPFVKWAGGKRCLLKILLANMPNRINSYYEPFVGGGALFFGFHQRLSKAYLSDNNPELMITYTAIKKDPKRLIELLKNHEVHHNKEYYYDIRQQQPDDPYELAARLIYLNKTCYNGLYRVNKSGKFNVPMGTYKNPRIVDENNILTCSAALKNVTLECHEFDSINPKSGDFVYFDPPYHPTDVINFTKYTQADFTEQDQVRLKDFAITLHKKGVKVMLSNSNADFIQDIYKGRPFYKQVVRAPRFVNCKKDKRNPVEELLITTYKPQKNIDR